MLPAAAKEFADTESMIRAGRNFGPYRWDRYDIVVMPPSFRSGHGESAAVLHHADGDRRATRAWCR
jgi:leukotriene-A4 hydrolase